MLYWLVSILFFIFSYVHANAYQYELCLCAIFQNEAPYLKEWIDFHKKMGVEHFYLANHLSTDNYLHVLQPYIDEQEVELFHVEENPDQSFNDLQEKTYTSIKNYCQFKTKWLLTIDSDEFVFPLIKENLIEFLKDYENAHIGSVYFFAQYYGTSFIEELPKDKKLIECLLYRAEEQFWLNKFGKSFCRPERCSIVSLHYAVPLPTYTRVLPNKTAVATDQLTTIEKVKELHVDVSKIRFNHYWTRDEKYYREVKIPRYINWGADIKTCRERYEALNLIFDDSILQFSISQRAGDF